MKSMPLVAAALAAMADALQDNGGSSRPFSPHHIIARLNEGVEQPITDPVIGTPTVQGCFKSSGNLVLNQTVKYNSIGACANDICAAGGFPVGGSMGGKECWCGEEYPPESDLVDDSKCNAPCSGYGEHACGGIDYWTIYNTGLDLTVKHMSDSGSSSSTSSAKTSTAPATAVVTLSGQTVVVTQAPTDEASGGGGGTNVAGVVAGVVVGVVVVASAVGGVFLYLRRKRNREIEEEHRRNAAVNAFIGKPPGSSGGMSMTDSRLDPVIAQRRLSDGSIADNQDYSRRILRVTNA